MAVQNSDAVAGRFAGLLTRGPFLRLGRCASGAQHAPKGASRTKDAGVSQLMAAAADAGSALSVAAFSAPVDAKMYSFGNFQSVCTAQFGHSLDRGEGSLEQPAIAEPESEIEAIPYLPAGFATGATEQVPCLDAAMGKPSYTGSHAPSTAPDSQDGRFQSSGAVALSVMDFNQAAPYLDGMRTSRAAAADAAEHVPYLNAATGKPCYTDSLAPTSAPDSPEGSFQSDDIVALSVTDFSQAAPYLECMLTSWAVAADVADQVPYLNALTGKPYYIGSLSPAAGLEVQEGSVQPEDMVAVGVMDSSEAAPYLDGASVFRARAVPYLL